MTIAIDSPEKLEGVITENKIESLLEEGKKMVAENCPDCIDYRKSKNPYES